MSYGKLEFITVTVLVFRRNGLIYVSLYARYFSETVGNDFRFEFQLLGIHKMLQLTAAAFAVNAANGSYPVFFGSKNFKSLAVRNVFIYFKNFKAHLFVHESIRNETNRIARFANPLAIIPVIFDCFG